MDIEIGNGIRLTKFLRTDEDSLVACLSEKEIYDRTLRIPYPYTAADARGWLDVANKDTDSNGRPVVFCAIRGESAELIGGVGLEGFTDFESHRAEIGYWLAKRRWGRGIMTSVVRAVCRHGFANLGLEKITANVFSFNDASARVLAKCGFEQEGFLRKQFMKDGKFVDAKIFALTTDMAQTLYQTAPSADTASVDEPSLVQCPAPPSELILRSYEERDEDQVVRLWLIVFPNDFPWNSPVTDIRRKLSTQRDMFVVGEFAGEIVATVLAGFDGYRGWMHRVAVSPPFRRRGFGQAIMNEAERRLRAIGCSKVNLQVRQTNQTVVAFHKSLGYLTEDHVSMGKLLANQGQGR